MVDNYTKANIPLDVMWGDIDYMERWRDFTFDPVNFPLPALQVRNLALAADVILSKWPSACAAGHLRMLVSTSKPNLLSAESSLN